MLVQVEELDHNITHQCDICIIGAGAAGIEIARSFNNSSLSVCLVEGGREEFDWETQNLSHFTHNDINIRIPDKNFDRTKPYNLVDIAEQASVLRQYGGTMNIWGGYWRHLDSVDFVDKNIYDMSAWPISFETIHKYYGKVAIDYDLNKWFNHEDELTEQERELFRGVKEITPNFGLKDRQLGFVGDKYYDTLTKSSNIQLILGANATTINMTENGEHIDSVVFKSTKNRSLKIRANRYILACGTIENTRLLLCTRKIREKNTLTGKNLISHPKGYPAIFVPPKQVICREYCNTSEAGISCGFRLSDEMLKFYGLPNHYISLGSCKVYNDSRELKYEALIVRVHLEQLPNLDSQIVLGDEVDELGQPLPHLDWKLKKMDVMLLRKYFMVFNKFVAKHNCGKLQLISTLESLDDFMIPSHFLGTTRMAKTPSEGVVDENCKVFGVDNLYVTGGGLFPTVGSANPTFTIIALARRLADHLHRM